MTAQAPPALCSEWHVADERAERVIGVHHRRVDDPCVGQGTHRGRFVEAQNVQSLGVVYADESEMLARVDRALHRQVAVRRAVGVRHDEYCYNAAYSSTQILYTVLSSILRGNPHCGLIRSNRSKVAAGPQRRLSGPAASSQEDAREST